MENACYRGLKLTDLIVKTAERIIEKPTRQKADINVIQYLFVPGRGTTDAIFTSRQFLGRKDVYFVFVDIKKAFGQFLRDAVWCTFRKVGVEESRLGSHIHV